MTIEQLEDLADNLCEFQREFYPSGNGGSDASYGIELVLDLLEQEIELLIKEQ
jgi:hypothetical protein